MISEIKTTNSSTIKYIDEAESYFLNVATDEDNLDYIRISFCGVREMVIPREVIPELVKILNQFK